MSQVNKMSWAVILSLLLVLAACSTSDNNPEPQISEGGPMLTLTSPAFEEGQPIPEKYGCDGDDISPALNWSDPPTGTMSFALIMDDPDAPVGTWVHWVIYNISAKANSLPENIPGEDILDFGALHGSNSWRRGGYGGPCPPSGTHRYFFKLYALDEALEEVPGFTKDQLSEKMEDHILAEAILMGTFSR